MGTSRSVILTMTDTKPQLAKKFPCRLANRSRPAHGLSDPSAPIRLRKCVEYLGRGATPRLTQSSTATSQDAKTLSCSSPWNSPRSATFPCGTKFLFPTFKETPDGETCLHFYPHRTCRNMRERASPTATRRLGCSDHVERPGQRRDHHPLVQTERL